MLFQIPLVSLLLLLPAPSFSFKTSPPSKNAILLSNVQTLTLRANRLTTSRRVSPIPQLKCTGPSSRICKMYPIEVMRCNNEGHDYDEEDIQWTCTADLPAELKLGSTDVICEGYRDSEDPFVLKGSCGVEYRLLLTELGERKFGSGSDQWTDWLQGYNANAHRWSWLSSLGDLLFFGLTIAVFAFIVWVMIRDCLRGDRRGRRFGAGWGGFGGGGGGGPGGGGPYYPGPPPPYSRCAEDDAFAYGSRSQGQGWRPGFWTGALGGAAAGYGLGSRNRASESAFRGGRAASYRGGYDPGEGSSRSASRFSSPTTSTGFGSTRRR